jgi:CO dehydrogenase maturation factor
VYNVPKRPFYASISGKGGTGKTVLTALLLRVLLEASINDEVLVVDADPATNLPQVLGIPINKTIGDVAEEFRRGFQKLDNLGFEKSALLEYYIMRDCIVEMDRFDFIAMGRGEGEGCYCYVNAVLSGILGKLVQHYSVVLMDMEAGLEHLNRRLDRHVNTFIIVVDNSLMSLKTAEKIKEIIREVNLKIDEIYVVGNRLSSKREEDIVKWASQNKLKYAGTIPEDKCIAEHAATGIPLLNLPSNSEALKAAYQIAKNINLI